MAKGNKDWTPADLDRAAQITRDRSFVLAEWEHYDKVSRTSISLWPRCPDDLKRSSRGQVWAMIVEKCTAILQHISIKLVPTAKAAWELFGIDLALTADWEMVCYEINSGPCIKNENKEMLHSLVDITLPFGYELSRPDPKLRWNVLVDTHPAELRAAAGCPTAKEGGAKPAAGDAAAVKEKWREPVDNLMARFGCGSAAAVESLTKSDGHAGKAAAALRLSFQEIPRVGTERPKSAGAEAAARSAAEQQAEKNEETAEDNVGAEAQAAREDKADAQQGVEEQAAANVALAEARQDASDAQTESGEETEAPAPAPAPPVASGADQGGDSAER